MNILVIGGGGREHALAHFCALSPVSDRVMVSPGNPGIAIEKKCVSVKCDEKELPELAVREKIDLAIIGPEAYLADGLADRLREKGIRVFGPGKAEAILESSKSYAKDFMKKYSVATASYEVFTDYEKAADYIRSQKTYPQVIKASGLCAGKGVIIAQNEDEALTALKDIMLDKVFSDQGDTVVIEEFLKGKETSILSLYDGKKIICLPSAMDHKKIFEGEKGPNTGGMGTISPSPYLTEEVKEDFRKNILEPTLKGLKEEGFTDPACIFFGLIITDKGVKLLEYNMRFGDPETQVVLTMLDDDILKLLYDASEGNLKETEPKIKDGVSICVVGAAPGYPGKYEKGITLDLPDTENIKVFHAGTGVKDGKLVSTGGRIFGATVRSDKKEDCQKEIGEYFRKYVDQRIQFRKDIGNV